MIHALAQRQAVQAKNEKSVVGRRSKKDKDKANEKDEDDAIDKELAFGKWKGSHMEIAEKRFLDRFTFFACLS